MRRRAFIAGLAGASLCHQLALAQNAFPVVGFVGVERGTDDPGDASFLTGLREAGFVEQRNVAIERHYVADVGQLMAAALELVRKNVAVICGPSNAIGAAKAATSTIPLVFIGGRDPVAAGLVSSLNKPGGNVTGVSLGAGELPAKQVELLHELLPTARKIGLLFSPGFTDSEAGTALAVETAHRLGIDLVIDQVKTEADIERAFEHLKQAGAGAVQVSGNVFLNSYRGRLADLAVSDSLPLVGTSRPYAVAGALMSYGTNPADVIRQAGIYVGRILKGEKPADLPVLQPTKFDLTVNMKTAKLLALEIPAMFLARADEVIE